MTDLLKSLKFCQWAVARKAFVEELTHFQIKDGFIRSFNGSISLCAPIDLALDCKPKAAAFIKAIATCKETVQLSLTPTGKLSIKSGKFRAVVECTQGEFPEMAPEGRELPLNGTFMEALRALEPIIGEDASRPWSRGILFANGRAYATNNVVLAAIDIDADFTEVAQINVPHAAVNELIRIGEIPTAMHVTDNSATFTYSDGRWLRTSLYSTAWPDLDAVLERNREMETELPESFFQALEDVAPFTKENRAVYFKPSHVTSSLDFEEATFVNVPGLPDLGKFNIDMWRMLSGLANSIALGSRQGVILFSDPFGIVRGAIIGMRE